MPARKNSCMMPEALRRALERERIWLRSEELPKDSFLQYYVDVGHIRALDSNANHLVSGRRGTGKTHLLGAFKEYINKSSKNTFAIMISILELSGSSTMTQGYIQSDRLARISARNQFNQFIRIFFDRFLFRISEHTSGLPHLEKRIVDNLLQDLLSEIELGSNFSEILNPDIDEDGSDRLANPSSVTFDPEHMIEETSDKSTPTSGSIDHQRVRMLVDKILQASGVELMHLLIDEWMELDKNIPSRVQNDFSQYLKKMFFNSNRISVVIASIWNQTSLYERSDMDTSAGIQIGHDIEHTVDLDTSFFDAEEEIKTFCKKLLFLRLSKKSPDLRKFELANGDIDDVFLVDVFDTPQNFKVFVAASHGIPRELMKIFQKASHKIQNDFQNNCICQRTIDLVAQNIYRQEKRETISPGSATKAMWARINDYMYQEKRRVFIIKDGAQKTSRAFRALIDHELIHELPMGSLPRWVRNKNRAFHIDYGNYVDWMQVHSSTIDEIVMESILPSWEGIEPSDLPNLTVEVLPDKDLYVICLHCEGLNLRDHPAFKKHGFCLNCGENPEFERSLVVT